MTVESSRDKGRGSMRVSLRIARAFALLLLPVIGVGAADAARSQGGGSSEHARADRSAHMRARIAEQLATRAPRVEKGSPATYVVDRADDSPLPAARQCTAALNDCTLRGAIEAANLGPSVDVIEFDIPGAGPHLLQIGGKSPPFPTLIEPVTIDGYSQPGAVANTDPVAMNAILQIVIDGAGLGVAGQNVSIHGLVIQNSSNSNNDTGLYVGAGATGGIYGSFIGTDASGNATAPNCDGIWLDREGATLGVFEVGSEGIDRRNLISGNTCAAVYADGDNWTIGNNLIGTNAAGLAALGNEDGVVVESSCNSGFIYSNASVGDGNVISGNTRNGVWVRQPVGLPPAAEKGCVAANASGLYVTLNRIGLTANGSATLLNDGTPVLIDADGTNDKIYVIDNEIGLSAVGFAAPRAPRGAAASMPFSENFDGVSAPGLPAGWTIDTALSSNGIPWVTSGSASPAAHTDPNVAFIDNEGTVSDKRMLSPTIGISAVPALLSFRNAFDLESAFDGMVLEIAVNGGAFADARMAGGSFLQGGYTGTLNGGVAEKADARGTNPLNGRNAWTANSLGRIETVYRLPASVVPGDVVQFRWRVGTDGSVANSGASIDSVTLAVAPPVVATAGIAVATGRKRVEIRENTQFNNGEGIDPGNLGNPFIDLNIDGRTANDAGDIDTGANELQNAPDIVSATLAAGNLSIDFTLDAPAGEGPFVVDFYQMTVGKAPIAYIGTHAGGSPASFAGVSLSPGNRIAAISRSTASGNTSELGVSYQLAGAVGPATCVWIPGGTGNWTNPAMWSNCGSGTGPGPGPAGTPGAPDAAQIDAGNVTLDVPVTVDALTLNGGTLTGDQTINVTTDFTWTGGTLEASSNAHALIVGAGSSGELSGGQKNLIGRTLSLQGGINRWTTGLIEMANGARLQIGATATLEIEPNAAEERIYFSNVGATPTISNAGTVIKKGPNTAGFDRGITFTDNGTVTIEDGRFRIRSNGSTIGGMMVASGATLEFSAGSFSLNGDTAVSGDGALEFGDGSGDAGTYPVTKCLATNGPVSIRNATVTIGCSTLQAFHELRLEHQAAVLQGTAQFAVSSDLQWFMGSILGNGAPAATITLNASATATWGNPALVDPRILGARDYINLGNTTVSAQLNQTVLRDNARVVNDASATFNLDQGLGLGVWASLGSGTPEFLNQGTLNVLNGQWNFLPVFTNTGSVNLSFDTELDLRAAGSDTGSYVIASNADLRIIGTNSLRSISGTGGISGAGNVEVLAGGQLTVSAPTYTVFNTNVGGAANTLLDLSTGAPVVVPRLSLSGTAGTITGSSPIEVNQYFVHEGGTITTTAAGISTLTLSATAGGGQFTSPAIKTYRQRSLVINSTDCNFCAPTFVWYDGDVMFEAGASLTVDTLLYTNADDSMLCAAPCTSALNINGRFSKANTSTITIGPGITINQAGQLDLQTGGFVAPPFTQTAGRLFINFSTTLTIVGGDFTLAGGELTGTGQIAGNVVNSGGLFNPGFPASTVVNYTINGNYTQGVGGTLRINTDSGGVVEPGSDKARKANKSKPARGSFGIDRVNISGTATLSGTLLAVNGGGTLNPPDNPTIVNATGGVTGVFSTYTTDFPTYFPQYLPTEVRLGVAPPVVNPVVNSVADPGTGTCDVAECTLREAITAANATPAVDTITFNIPGAQCTGTGGTCEIHPLTPLPKIQTAITIDGYTQPGANANTQTIDQGLGSTALIKIEIDGTVAGGVGLELAAPGTAVNIEGLAITDFNTGIRVVEAAVTTQLQLQNGVPVSGTVNSVSSEDDFEEYVVVIPSGVTNLDVATTNAPGDVDLYVRFGAAPSLTEFDCRPYSGSGNESCNFPAPAAGTYFVRVYGFDTGPQNFDVTATWSGAGAARGNPATTVTLGGNYLGLHADGSAGTQAVGLMVDGTGLTVGDGSARSMNVISGNQNEGVLLASGRPGSFASIQGNLIGPAPNGTAARPNQHGIKAVSSSNIGGITIGGGLPALGNVIARNAADGIHLSCDAAADVCFDGMQVIGNYIGTNALGAALGNLDDGIGISNLTGGQVSIGSSGRNGANVIHHNAGNGIETDNFTGGGRMSFLVNRINTNGGAGIDLANDGPTPNDPGDEDNGPNGRQNFPDNLVFVLGAGGTSADITWEIDTPFGGTNYPMRVDFYKQTGDEHDIWLGTSSCGVPLRVSCSGSITFPAGVTLSSGDRMAAIVTDNEGRSSEAGFFGAPLVDPVVTSVADPGDGTCDAAECTLREAIAAAEFTPAPDTISFAIPAAQCAGGVCVIAATASLPNLTTPIFIDGYTQPGASANTLAPGLGQGSNAIIKIELDGGPSGTFSGLNVEAPGASVRIEGLAIHGFNSYQIGTDGGADSNAHIGGNFLGLRANGSLPPPVGLQLSFNGIRTSGGTVQIGDGTARRMNVISGSPDGYGIEMGNAPSDSTVVVVGNLIGTAQDGVSARPNGAGGIRAVGSSPLATDKRPPPSTAIVIGGDTLDLANVIGHNDSHGVAFDCDSPFDCFGGATVLGNFIGVGMGNQVMGNAGDGIHVGRLASGRLVFGGPTRNEANVIANNIGAGIRAELSVPKPGGPRGNVSVLVNRTFNNGGLGVDILDEGRDANDPGDVDGDTPQNFPEFTSYTRAADGASASFGFGIDTASNGSNYPMRVDFYRGEEDELGVWLGTANCAATGACTANITFPAGVTLSSDDSVVAIATDGMGRSSELSFYVTTTVIVSDNPDPSEVGTPYTVVVSVTSAQPFKPLGTVEVSDSTDDTCVATLASASANSTSGSCQILSDLPAGTRMLFALYPDVPSPFVTSSAFTTHQIVQTVATTTSIATISPSTTVVGQPYTVTVNVVAGGAPVTQGIVTVRQLHDNATCLIDLSAATSCQLVSSSALTTAVRATYPGSTGSFGASQSSVIPHVVERASTLITILSDTPDPSLVNQPITVTMSLGVVAPGAGTPTGSFLITDGTASCGVDLPNLSCSFIPKIQGLGSLEARYLGDANFNASVDTEAHTVSVDGADLSIVKFNGRRLLPGGSTVTYILLVSNAGPQAVVNARVNDILPSQLSNASWTCSASNGASCPASGVGTVDTLVSLPANSSLSFALTVSVQASPEQIVVNRATVTPPANAPDPFLGNNESTDTDLIGIFGDGFESEIE